MEISPQGIPFNSTHREVVDRFLDACQADERIVAAFLSGSYARGTADEFSDLDLNLIAADGDYAEVLSERDDFVRNLGEPAFIEDFGNPDILFYILTDGSEGELAFGRESSFGGVASGEFKVLLDKKGILAGAAFPKGRANLEAQREESRRVITWFWHEMSHFITALGRGQLWWAQGQLEALRGHCVALARLQYDFTDADASDEPYFKIETAMPVEELEPLRGTFCSLERAEMLEAGMAVLQFYRETATTLTGAHGLPYPQALDRIMSKRLENLQRRV
ncbi:MAG TPA: aminoglycoside 6-adenylyltransferase [Anaerolineales bacterium]|nr:aminoglycoside 6-adenylyltransferase [Anaerolineales bacterium]